MDDNDVDFTLVGTGLSEVTEVYLYNSDYDNIDAKYVDVVSSTTVEGTFDLSDTEEDTYEVCVVDSLDADECDLSLKSRQTLSGVLTSRHHLPAHRSMSMVRQREQPLIPWMTWPRDPIKWF